MPSFLTSLLITALAAVTVSSVSLLFLIPYLTKKSFLDIPNSRSSHTKITPRGGGIAVVLGIFAGTLTAYFLKLPVPHFTFFAGLLLIAVTSFIDDKKNLPVLVRLAAHLTAIGLVIWYTGGIQKLPFPSPLNFELGLFAYVLSAIWILSVINFYNFLDGIDGFAGSQAMIAGIGLSTIYWGTGTSVISVCIAMSALGFLFYNWHPAKIFMGDVGSVSLGFAFATLPFYAEKTSKEEGVFSVAVFLWFFLADGAFTLVRRMLNKEKIWQAHRTHLYQRLNKSGWPHDKIVSFIMFFALIIMILQIYMVNTGNGINWYSLATGTLLFLIYIFLVFRREQSS